MLKAVEKPARKQDAMWTDPPYGVEYVGKTADALTIAGGPAGPGHAEATDHAGDRGEALHPQDIELAHGALDRHPIGGIVGRRPDGRVLELLLVGVGVAPASANASTAATAISPSTTAPAARC